MQIKQYFKDMEEELKAQLAVAKNPVDASYYTILIE
jgi:hypothetical protein